MLALGADGVLLGRAWLYALAARGEAGVTQLLTLIEREMRVAMALTGVRSIAGDRPGYSGLRAAPLNARLMLTHANKRYHPGGGRGPIGGQR